MHRAKFYRLLILFMADFSFQSQSQTLEDSLNKCAKISNSDARLSCFDEIVITSSAPVRSEQTVAPTTNKFGLKAKTENEPDSLIALVTKIKKNPYGMLTVTLDNGQKWKQTESRKLKLKKGQKIQIDKGAFDSFLMKKIDSNTSIRVKRIK